MSALFKTKTTFRSKFSALGALLLVLNFATAWGQTVELDVPTGNNRTLIHNIECGTYQVVTKTLPIERTDRTFTYTFQNNTGSTVTISNIKLNTVRYRIGNNSNTFDYIRIYRVNSTNTYVDYGSSTNNDYYPNDSLCSSTGSGGSQVRIYSTENTLTGNNNTISLTNGQLTLTNGQSISFRISKNIDNTFSSDCTPVGFSATITGPACCPGTPTLTYPADGAMYAEGASSITLDWNDVNYANGYTVKVTDAEGNAISNAGVNATSSQYSLDLTSFTEGKYTWTVTPTTDVQGCNPQGASRIFYVVGCPTLISPADNATITSGDPMLEWEDVPGISQYKVTITNSTTSETAITRNVSATSLTLGCSDLANGTYTWSVVPLVDGSPVSGLNCTTTRTFTKNTTLSCVTNPQPADGTVLERRLLSWDPVPCAEKYIVYVAPTSVGIGNLTTSTDNRIYKKEVTTTELHLPIMAQGDYYWTVIPENTASGKVKGCSVNTFSIRYASGDDHDISPSTQGTDFFFSLMENGYRDNSTSNRKYKAIIAPKEDATVTFHYYANNSDVQYTVSAGTTREIELTEALVYHDTPGDQKNRTVRVTSTADISLYISNEANNSFDASIVLPTTALGADYMIQTYPSGTYENERGRPCFMIIATEDNTVVNISGTNSGNISPTATSVTLNEGESYFVISNKNNVNDLSGLKINVAPRNGHPEDSCKTIAVFNGNVVTGVPTSMTNNRDHLVEQAYPISNWGTKFAITSTDGYVSSSDSKDVDYIRITAAEATTGTINDGTTTTSFTLAAGATYDYQLHRSKGSCYIETNKPVACYLYQRSAAQIRINSSTDNDDMGDPSMVWIAPIERGIEKITFSTFAATGINNGNHWVNIVIPADSLDIRTSGRDERKTVWLGNRDITSNFQTNGTLNYVKGSNNKYAYARVKINHGTYTVYSNCGAKMVLHVYGLGNVRGYAYNAGSAAVPYKSAFSIGDGEREFDMTALPEDYHFCSGQKYVFRVSSNGDMDSVIFDFQNGERKTLKNISPKNNTVEHIITEGGNYRITSYVFSTVYNHELCQKEVMVDTVEDYTFIFLSLAETVNDSVCYNTPYTYTRTYWTYNDNDTLVKTTFTHNFNTSYASNQTLHIDNAKSQYGCDIKLTINLKVFGEMTPGAIGSEEVKCKEGSDGSANLSVTMLTNSASASGGASDAHYEWQKRRITSIAGTDTTWADTDWITITNQTNPTYTVTEPAAYRRVYTSATCGTVYSNLIYVSHAGSFVPGTHIDEVVRVCNYETVNRTIGGDISASSIRQDTGYYVVVPTNGTQETIRLVIYWQKSEDTQDNWQRISGATSYNYSINQTFSRSTYFRRIIDLAVTDCNLNLSMGVFAVEVKPDYTITTETLSGCYNNNNASALLSITGGSGNFGVTYKLQNSSDSPVQAVLQGGKYKCSPLNQGVNYTYTVVDNTHGCTKTGTINIANPTPLNVATISNTVEGCQGSTIQLPVPAITGGMLPYSVVITSSGLGISESSPLRETVQTPGTQTSTSYNVPLSVTAENKTLSYQINDINNCPITSDQTVVKINAVPEFNLTSTPLGSCSQPNATITATVTNAPAAPKYDYTINPENRFSATNQGTTSYTFGSTVLDAGLPQGTYEIVVTDKTQTTSCATKKEHTISSAFKPDVEVLVSGLNLVAVNQYSGCPNKDITVSVSSIAGIDISSITPGTYKYKIDATAEYGTSYTFTGLKTAKTCGTQIINVYVREESSGCEFVQEVKIVVEDNENPTIATTLTNVDVITYFCDKYTVPGVDYIKNNIKNYISDNCASADDLTVSVTPTPNSETYNVADGQRNVTITVKDLCGKTATKSITITPKPWPAFEISGTETVDGDNNCYCHGDNIVLTAILGYNDDGSVIPIVDRTYPGATYYHWYKVTTDPETGTETETEINTDNDDDGRYSGYDTKELKISSAVDGDAGVYKLVITDPTKEKCTKEATITICVHPNIKFNLE